MYNWFYAFMTILLEDLVIAFQNLEELLQIAAPGNALDIVLQVLISIFQAIKYKLAFDILIFEDNKNTDASLESWNTCLHNVWIKL